MRLLYLRFIRVICAQACFPIRKDEAPQQRGFVVEPCSLSQRQSMSRNERSCSERLG